MPLWYSCLHAAGLIRGNYYLRVVGAWGMFTSGVDKESIRALTDAAVQVRAHGAEHAYEDVVRRLVARRQ